MYLNLKNGLFWNMRAIDMKENDICNDCYLRKYSQVNALKLIWYVCLK